MNTKLSAQNITENCIYGYHEYVLSLPPHVSFASNNLTTILSVDKTMLESDEQDLYLNFVHPQDTQRYITFLCSFTEANQTKSLQYYLVTADRKELFVQDTITTKLQRDGTLIGYSTLCDLTSSKNKLTKLQFLNDTIPCGFLRYTCETQPKITYINSHLLKILKLDENTIKNAELLELYTQNLFLLVSQEDLVKFKLFLNKAYSYGSPIAGELSVKRADGSKARLFGWITKIKNEEDCEEYQTVCIDVTEREQLTKNNVLNNYVRALQEIYEKIFEYNFETKSVKCIQVDEPSVFKKILNVSMNMEEATKNWLFKSVSLTDLPKVNSYFDQIFTTNYFEEMIKPPTIEYEALSSDGSVNRYQGIFLKASETVGLYCCHKIKEELANETLRLENVTLKQNLQQLAMRFSEGCAAFEVKGENVTPLYASDNVCEFFGYTTAEWLPLMQKSTPLKQFVIKCNTKLEDFEKLLTTGEATFSYYDLSSKKEKIIKAICSNINYSKEIPRYVLLYNMTKTIYIRTFGYFDVFVNDTPIAFRNKKSKELLALLVNRRGGFVTSEEAISFLWEEEPINSVTLSRYRKVALRLKNILEEYEISDIVEAIDGKRRLVMETVKCDLFDYLSGKAEYEQLFKGTYLSNYSWGENTLAELSKDFYN